MIEPKIIEALKIINQKLKGQKIEWVLVGSTGLALRGVRIEPKDIDILTDEEGAFKINRLLKEYEIEPVKFKESDKFQSYFGKFKIKEVNVEVMGNLQIRKVNEWTPFDGLVPHKTVDIEGMRLPVFSLKKELESYEKLGREKDAIRVQKIKKFMQKRTELSREPTPKIHLRYIRLPNQVMDVYDTLIYRSEKVIVLRSQITSTHLIVFDDEVVLAPGFEIVCFELIGKWFIVGKIINLQGGHTGYYCDIVTPPRILEDGGVELTDLFLDLWVSPDLRYRVLDEEELENAFKRGWITKRLYDKAKKELKNLVNVVREGEFPPYRIRNLETKLHL